MPIEKEIEKIFRKDKAAIRKIILEFQSDFDAVDDWMMDTFHRAYEKRDQFDGDKSRLLTWVCNIAKTVCIDHIREAEAKKRPEILLGAIIEAVEDCDAYYDQAFLSPELAEMCGDLDPARQHEAVDAVSVGVSIMSELMQRVFKLRFEGYDYSQVSEKLNITEAYARKLVERSRNFVTNDDALRIT